jgi:predicted membrane channel-forming protein YqfA (hemolysin III family)
MSDWTTEAVDRIEEVVATVRDKTVVPAQNVTRALVYGLLTAFFVGTALTFLAIAAFRALSAYLPGGVYWAYLVLGGIFVIVGGLLWAKRAPRSQPGKPKSG